jgi:hypothetical protein
MTDHKLFNKFIAESTITCCKHYLYYSESDSRYYHIDNKDHPENNFKWCRICNTRQSIIINDRSKNVKYVEVVFNKHTSHDFKQFVKFLLKCMLHLKYFTLHRKHNKTLTIIIRQLFKHKRMAHPNYHRFNNKNKLHYNHGHKYIANNIYFIL